MFCSQLGKWKRQFRLQRWMFAYNLPPASLFYFIVWFVLCINPILKIIKVLFTTIAQVIIIECLIFVFSLSNIIYIIFVSTFELYNLVPNFGPPEKLYFTTVHILGE